MHSQAFSLLSRAFTSVDLDPLNEEWKLCQNFAFENGFSLLAFVPSSYKDGSYVDECIELVTMPCVNENKTINQIFATDRKIIQEETNERVMFDILKETSTEVIYCYSYPKDHLRLNAIVRTSVDNKGYRSLSYKRGIIGKMKQEDVLFWQNKLEAIDINSRK